MLLENKNVVITGAMQGIGKATVEQFAKEGANIFACCQHEDEAIKKEFNEIASKNNIEIIPIYFDMMDNDAIKKGVMTIRKTKKPINTLVNIAGVNIDALFHMITMDQIQKTFQINFFSQIILTQYITKLMLRTGGGSVINTASISGIDGNSGQLSYSSSKAAIIAATKTISQELGSKGIRVNAIAPGVIRTSMTENLPDEAMTRLMNKSNIKHLGTPEEVAKVIAFLASDMASDITGQVIRIDGGIG